MIRNLISKVKSFKILDVFLVLIIISLGISIVSVIKASSYLTPSELFVGGGAYIAGSDNLNAFTVTTDGKVGIGTMNPTSKLQVNSASGDVVIGITTSGEIDTNVDSGSYTYYKNSDQSQGWLTGLINWDQEGNYSILQSEGPNWTRFFTITAAGNVGIGTNYPGSKLEVAGDLTVGEITYYATPKTVANGGLPANTTCAYENNSGQSSTATLVPDSGAVAYNSYQPILYSFTKDKLCISTSFGDAGFTAQRYYHGSGWGDCAVTYGSCSDGSPSGDGGSSGGGGV